MTPDRELTCVRVVEQRGEGDCCIAVLAMLLGMSYEDVLAAASQTMGAKVHREGMWTHQILRTAKAIGSPLKKKKSWDLETDTGIVVLENTYASHVVVAWEGLLLDTSGTIWQPDVYLKHYEYTPVEFLVRA